ncbi:imidazole glycerol phosphate synthase subunit HisH [Cognatishimia sp. SS12]|uniref:imidazole glycerol phosphate synthase subunit HisH n=1 Tax=Cognatishimia sp. SS12 TaxID=2979465 RepID=UPI00232E54EC|nr:imidazole glycerol phosphate synthase subunit HisH [Cognatishimia sp. SS12]MDC0738820.1 imidazole glycerol phosphate synthase subunit HisH [Cognatishimia sp. SS12]
MLTAIIDYESGNLHSAEKAFQRMARELDAGEVVVTSDAEVVAKADRLVLPGDGAFPACAAELRGHKGIYDAMVEAVEDKGRPFLGICVGMQLMATTGHEYQATAGLNWVKGDVVPITPVDASLKVPHMGWNDLIIDTPHAILDGVENGQHVYFVHSYHFQVSNPAERLAHVDYAGDITAIIGRDTMVGMQFHPEKSQKIGLQMIGNFLNWRP